MQVLKQANTISKFFQLRDFLQCLMNFRSGQSNHIQALIHETISLAKQGDFLDPQITPISC